jgi:hypothetical protein
VERARELGTSVGKLTLSRGGKACVVVPGVADLAQALAEVVALVLGSVCEGLLVGEGVLSLLCKRGRAVGQGLERAEGMLGAVSAVSATGAPEGAPEGASELVTEGVDVGIGGRQQRGQGLRPVVTRDGRQVQRGCVAAGTIRDVERAARELGKHVELCALGRAEGRGEQIAQLPVGQRGNQKDASRSVRTSFALSSITPVRSRTWPRPNTGFSA